MSLTAPEVPGSQMEAATSTYDLIRRIQEGDREALSQLFESYRPRLAVLIHYRLTPEQRRSIGVEDVLQETLLKAFRDFEQFAYRRPGSFLHWVSRIAEHVIIDLVRFEGRRKRQAGERAPFRSESQPQGVELVDAQTPSRILAEDEGVRRLLALLDGLPEEQREVLLLAKFEERTTEEIAERVGRSRQAVALLLHRAIKRLRRLQETRSEE